MSRVDCRKIFVSFTFQIFLWFFVVFLCLDIRTLYRRFCVLFLFVLGPEFPLVFLCVLVVRSPFSVSLVALFIIVGFWQKKCQKATKAGKFFSADHSVNSKCWTEKNYRFQGCFYKNIDFVYLNKFLIDNLI